MDAKFHHESAKIYDFAQARRPAPAGSSNQPTEPRLFDAEVVSMSRRSERRATPNRVEPSLSYADFGSGWYHDVAIDKGDPSRH